MALDWQGSGQFFLNPAMWTKELDNQGGSQLLNPAAWHWAGRVYGLGS
jgi:hypothetical protein